MNQESPRLAFLISLIAGILILTGGFFTSMAGILLRITGFESANAEVTWPGALGSGVGLFEFGVGLMGVVGVFAGIIVILAALMLAKRPKKRSTWGSLIILFSFFSIYGAAVGGFGIGLILGLIGGVLAVTWKPKNIENQGTTTKTGNLDV
ncbi:MAG TPA: DUF6114 domain-containing protein [Candidatus Bathyarchaeia archaeon]|nr:DUF6114 domain-containing protein [Candidatus Bathyarchaeia archaeon]